MTEGKRCDDEKDESPTGHDGSTRDWVQKTNSWVCGQELNSGEIGEISNDRDDADENVVDHDSKQVPGHPRREVCQREAVVTKCRVFEEDCRDGGDHRDE